MKRKTLNFLIIISAITAISVLYFYPPLYDFFKPLTTILILLIPILYGNKKLKQYRNGIIAALVFCLLGDTFLLRDAYFIYGLAAFLIAHLLFAFSFTRLGGFRYALRPIGFLVALSAGYYYYLYPNLESMKIPVAIYIGCIVLMCWQGVALFLRERHNRFLMIAIAVLLFLFSDALIALEKFKMDFASSGILILSTYWLSILLLANSTVTLFQED